MTLSFYTVSLSRQLEQASDSAQPSASIVCGAEDILFERSQLKIGWQTQLDFGWKRGAPLKNLGNTCYVNVVLQTLFHTPAFHNWLWLDDANHRKKNPTCNCYICMLWSTLEETYKNPNRQHSPISMVHILQDTSKEFTKGTQQDAFLYLTNLINALNEQFKIRYTIDRNPFSYDNYQTPLTHLFQGEMFTEIDCKKCGYSSSNNSILAHLDVAIPATGNLVNGLRNEFAVITNECGICHQKTAEQRKRIKTPPIVLRIQL